MSNNFNDFRLHAPLREALDVAGFETPTPIQREAIPILLEGRDLIGVAETGTGKTLAFLLPIFQGMDRGDSDPKALVVCPTRELAQQVGGEAQRFGGGLGVRTVLAYGGTSSGDQKRALAEGCDLVVGTPGRLLDFVNSAWLSLRKLRYLVLDEADRMLDMGFIDDVDAILRRSPMSRQTILFSATIPDAVRDLAQRYMFHPEIVEMHTGTRVTSNVDHAFYPVRHDQKDALLLELLRRERPGKFLVFSATREGTTVIGRLLRKQRHEVISLSSLLSQANRERALEAFRSGECDALVATDVAARGLDITDIDLVINFDVPRHAEEYVHRIGRTGRAERSGKAITLVSELDERRAREIEQMLGEEIVRVQLDGFAYRTPARPRRRDAGRGGPGGRRASQGDGGERRRARGRRSGGGKGPGGARRSGRPPKSPTKSRKTEE
jgi:ATP-dependent RNA helicase RhlE